LCEEKVQSLKEMVEEAKKLLPHKSKKNKIKGKHGVGPNKAMARKKIFSPSHAAREKLKHMWAHHQKLHHLQRKARGRKKNLNLGMSH
jgi:hypothetical protein